MNRQQEMFCTFLTVEFFMKAKEVNQIYNALLYKSKEIEEKGGMKEGEFKEWLDNELLAHNKSWTEQCEAINRGASEEEVRAIATRDAEKRLEEILDDKG